MTRRHHDTNTGEEKVYDLFLPTSAAALDMHRILDEEKLLHLHPHWFVDAVEQRDRGLFASLRDYATDRNFSLGLRMDPCPESDTADQNTPFLYIRLFDSPAGELLFYADQDKSRVKVRYSDGPPDDDREQDILLWIRAIQEYLRLYTKTSPRTLFFRLLMNKMVLQMNPSQRKICLMLTKITAIEILLIIILVAGYVYFGK